MRRAFGLGMMLCLAACAGESGIGSITVGGGERTFEPLTDGQDVPLIFGSQGGYHVWVSMRVPKAENRDRLSVIIELGPDGASEPAERSELELFFEAGNDGAWDEHVGFPAQIARPAACVAGRTQRLRVALSEDPNVDDVVRIIPRDAEAEAETCPEDGA